MMAILSFLDPPKSDEQRREERRRENDPSQDRFRQELPGIVSLIFGLTVGFSTGFVIFTHWIVWMGLHA